MELDFSCGLDELLNETQLQKLVHPDRRTEVGKIVLLGNGRLGAIILRNGIKKICCVEINNGQYILLDHICSDIFTTIDEYNRMKNVLKVIKVL